MNYSSFTSGWDFRAVLRLSSAISVLVLGTALQPVAVPSAEEARWPEEKARAWQQKTGWLVGCNFLPSTAINQLEMFQANTFDLATIDRELGWAQSLGFNSVRVYLQNLLWDEDPQVFLRRLDRFLAVAGKHRIGVVFVLFDSCWDPFPKLGPQRAPKPHLHNSGWVQSPGAEVLLDPAKQPALEGYVAGVVGRFRNDPRVHAWDVWNEPDNMNRPAYIDREPANKVDLMLPLLQKAFAWARQAKPSQPLTSGVWIGTWPDPEKLSPTEQVQLSQSDVISFHNYNGLASLKAAVENLGRYHRPLLCTEYMSRGNGSFFEPNLGYLKSQGVAGYNWGLVDGKSQTIYPWDSWTKSYDAEPVLWFHDIFRRDGKSYRPQEVAYIQDIVRSEVLFSGADLAGWRQPHGDWRVAEGVALEAAKPEAFTTASGLGVMVNGASGRTVDLMTEAEFGDLELHVEFCVAKHSNSGVYLQGRYEIQVYDSYGVEKDAYPGIECGGIYPRWINEQGVDGHSPRVNASKPPGEWQTFDIHFHAPRFDAAGKKIANAQMVRVSHNGQVIHENVDLKGPTRSAHWADEKALGPILLQGDHGPVAYRNLRAKAMQDDFQQNARLGRGVNILGWDALWQDRARGQFKDVHFKLIREAGFNHVRINLHPLRDGKPDANGKLRDEFFKTLDWAVDQALTNGLLVILDYHDDLAISPDPEGKKKEFLDSWTAMAEHCKNRPDTVLFEILNEPASKFTHESWNAYWHAALAIIRQSNPNRTVIIGPAKWNGVGELDNLKLPADDRHIIATVHYYNPFPFTHQGTPWTGQKDKLGVTWTGTGSEMKAIEQDFFKVANWAKQNQRPIYIGEFGTYEKADMRSRVSWTAFVVRQFEKQGWSWGCWQFADNFALFDMPTQKWVEPIRDALIPKKKD